MVQKSSTQMSVLRKETAVANVNNSYWQRYLLAGIFAASLLVVTMTNVHPAQADMQCNAWNGAACSQFGDLQGGSWSCAYFSRTATLGKTQVQQCLRSLTFVGTGDNERYGLFDQQIITNPDTGTFGLWWVTNSTYNFEDTASAGTNSTTEARLWSINSRNTSCSSNCTDQRNYSGLEQDWNCVSNGSTQTISLNATIGKGGAGWSETDPLNSACITVPPSDWWSQYYDHTLINDIWGYNPMQSQRLKVDFSFSQIMPQNSGGQMQIGYSCLDHFNSNNTIGGITYGMGSGNWTNHFNF